MGRNNFTSCCRHSYTSRRNIIWVIMSRIKRIEESLDEGMSLLHLDVIDESDGHNMPVGSESHFKLIAVAKVFEGLSRVNRHRQINGILRAEFEAGLHALSIHAYTMAEWEERFGEAPLSPPCAH